MAMEGGIAMVETTSGNWFHVTISALWLPGMDPKGVPGVLSQHPQDCGAYTLPPCYLYMFVLSIQIWEGYVQFLKSDFWKWIPQKGQLPHALGGATHGPISDTVF